MHIAVAEMCLARLGSMLNSRFASVSGEIGLVEGATWRAKVCRGVFATAKRASYCCWGLGPGDVSALAVPTGRTRRSAEREMVAKLWALRRPPEVGAFGAVGGRGAGSV